MKTIKFKSTDMLFKVTERVRLSEMRKRCESFFTNNRQFHQDRKYTVYRGQLLVEAKREQKQVYIPFLFLIDGDDQYHQIPDLFCIGHFNTKEDAEERIDEILETGEYK